MNTEVGSVHSQALGLYSEINGLQERVSRRRVPDCGEGVQWPNERKPIFFMQDKFIADGCFSDADMLPLIRAAGFSRVDYAFPLRPH